MARAMLLGLGLWLAACHASGCLTYTLIYDTSLPPNRYGELIGLERRGPGEDRFIYYVKGYTGAPEGYYWVQPAGDENAGDPLVGAYGSRDELPAGGIEIVPVEGSEDRRRDDGAPRAADPGGPHYRILRFRDPLRREHHRYERWSPEHERWLELGYCTFGTRAYHEPPRYVFWALLPFLLPFDLIVTPFAVLRWLVQEFPEWRADRHRTYAPAGTVIGADASDGGGRTR